MASAATPPRRTSVFSQSLHLGLGLGLVVLGLGLALGLALLGDVGALVMVILSVVNTRNEPMTLKLLRVVPTPGVSKKYVAGVVLPNGRQRTVRFGTGSNYVSNPRKTARDRAAYIARHRVNENHNDPLTPGALSRWLLWGESRSLARNTAAFRRRFRLQ